MFRTLLALSLALSVIGAQAAEAPQAEAEAPSCIKSEPAAGKPDAAGEGAAATARPGTPAPVRPRGSSPRNTPRWHSLLPGMFR